MTSSSDALRTTSDALLRDLEVLGALEEEKRTIDPGDPRLVDLATQIESIAKRVLSDTARQRRLSEVVNVQVRDESPDAPTASIDDTPRARSAILAEWRDAERRLAAADPASAEWTEADTLVRLLREEFRRASSKDETAG